MNLQITGVTRRCNATTKCTQTQFMTQFSNAK